MPDFPLIIPPVGKSGPGISFISSSNEISGLLIKARQAEMDSSRLCGAIFVAIPTAIPEEPFISKFGIRVGRTSGIVSWPS